MICMIYMLISRKGAKEAKTAKGLMEDPESYREMYDVGFLMSDVA